MPVPSLSPSSCRLLIGWIYTDSGRLNSGPPKFVLKSYLPEIQSVTVRREGLYRGHLLQ